MLISSQIIAPDSVAIEDSLEPDDDIIYGFGSDACDLENTVLLNPSNKNATSLMNMQEEEIK